MPNKRQRKKSETTGVLSRNARSRVVRSAAQRKDASRHKSSRNSQRADEKEGPIRKDIRKEFAREQLRGIADEAEARRDAHASASPEPSAADVDANWEASDVGDEAVGGTVSTPDQDVVEEIGEALGVTYDDDEPLDPEGKIRRRDEERWELNAASSEDFQERQRELDEDLANEELQPPTAGQAIEKPSDQAQPQSKEDRPGKESNQGKQPGKASSRPKK